jgi:hypothetical protein
MHREFEEAERLCGSYIPTLKSASTDNPQAGQGTPHRYESLWHTVIFHPSFERSGFGRCAFRCPSALDLYWGAQWRNELGCVTQHFEQKGWNTMDQNVFDKTLEERCQEVYTQYQQMLSTAFGGDVPEMVRYCEYMANILDGVEALEDLQRVVTSMVYLPGQEVKH